MNLEQILHIINYKPFTGLELNSDEKETLRIYIRQLENIVNKSNRLERIVDEYSRTIRKELW